MAAGKPSCEQIKSLKISSGIPGFKTEPRICGAPFFVLTATHIGNAATTIITAAATAGIILICVHVHLILSVNEKF